MDESGLVVPDDTPGELVVRYSEATKEAWRGGWFHTGDIVTRSPDGMLHFMDRRKNIIRRSGENIAAAKAKALLLTHPLVANVAVMARPMTCVRKRCWPASCSGSAATARPRTTRVPCSISATQTWPTTRPQVGCGLPPRYRPPAPNKIQKHRIFPEGQDPRVLPSMYDLRAFKKCN